MKKIYISKDADVRLTDYLTAQGYALEYIHSEGVVDEAIANHPDVFRCV